MNIHNSSARNGARVSNSQQTQVSTEVRQRLTNLIQSGSDQVSLSEFSAALKAADSNSPQQVARLEELGAAAANNSYQIDAPAVSESILNGHLRA